MQALPFYRLKELIIEKYGKDKFDTGCKLLVQWVRHDIPCDFKAEDLELLCEAADARMSFNLSLSLMRLFKLHSTDDLCTDPLTNPYNFQTKTTVTP